MTKRCLWPLLALATLSPSCSNNVFNDNPLSDPKEAKADEKLYGKWESVNDGFRYFLTIDKLQPGNDTPGIMKLAFCDDKTDFELFCTTLNGKTYMNVGGKKENGAKDYVFHRYAITDDKLTVWFPNVEILKNAVEKQQLKGEVKMSGKGDLFNFTNVHLKESTANLRQFFEGKKGQDVFDGDGGAFVFTRKKVTSQ